MDQGFHPITDSWQKRAIGLARSHVVTDNSPESPPILAQLSRVSSWLDDIIRMCRHPGVKAERAARWILDNDYQIRRTVRQVTEDMPPDFYNVLPRLESDQDRNQ